MRKYKLLLLSVFVLLLFSFETVNAQTVSPAEDNSAQLSLIEEKRKLINEHIEDNKKLEAIVEKKSKKVEDQLVKVPESTVVPPEVLENQISGRMETIMSHLMQIGEQEDIMWKSIKAGNRSIKAGNYSLGIKQLDKTIGALVRKHEHLVEFNSDLDELLAFFSTIQQK